ncbi:MAG: hypothetical protein ACT4QB_19085 [Gammaproteobacteria bacterium]
MSESVPPGPANIIRMGSSTAMTSRSGPRGAPPSQAVCQGAGLSSEEARYIDVRQGTHCRACGSNVRSIALAKALLGSFQFEGTLDGFVDNVDHHALGFSR